MPDNRPIPKFRDEAHFQRELIIELKQFGWVYWHDNDSRRNRSGWPDMAIFHPIRKEHHFWELKMPGRFPSKVQVQFIETMRVCGLNAAVKYPDDWWDMLDIISGDLGGNVR